MKTKVLLTMFLSSLVLLFSSCDKSTIEPEKKNTTYTLKYEISVSDLNTNPFDSYKLDMTVCMFEYNAAGEKIGVREVENPAKYSAVKFIANENAVKVKVYLDGKLSNGKQSADFKKWVQLVYYLEPESNTDIVVSGNTRVGSTEP